MSAKGIIRFLIARIFEVLVIILLILFMPSLPPQAKFETPYKLPQTLPFEGKLALNEKLNNVEIWHKSDLIGPEAFAVYDSELYTSIHGGDVVKLTGNHITPVVKFGKPCKGLYEEKICGRPLGLDFDKDGTLYAADAYYGIFKVNIKTGDKVQLVSPEDEIDGKVPKIFNSVKLASNGDLYWSDSSTEFDLQDGLFDMFADGSGRLIHYNAKTKQNTVLIKDIHFANGVNLADDESFVLVNEIGRNRIRRYYLKGPKKGTHDFFIEGLPGLPDNLISDGQGGFLVPLVLAVDDEHPLVPQILGPFPLARKFVARVFGLFEVSFRFWDRVYPNEYAQRAVHFVGHFQSFTGLISPKRVTILRISKTGEIIDSLHGLNGRISGISEAIIFKDTLYLGSPFNDYIARIPLSDIGWEGLAQKPAKKSPEKQTTQSPPPVKQTTPPVTQAPPTKQTPTASAPVVTKETPKVQKEPPTTKAPPKPTTQSPPSNNIPKSDSRPGKDSQKPVKDIPK